MPAANNFRHQIYSADLPSRDTQYELLAPEASPVPDAADYDDRLATFGKQLADAGVRRIVLLHGTFVGTDGLGLYREINRLVPGIGPRLQQQRKALVDRFTGENGNFTPDFARHFMNKLNRDIGATIDVITLDWSGENTHTGRVDGLLRLVDFLIPDDGITKANSTKANTIADSIRQTLLLGHSHAGNVFALLTNLVGADESQRREFLRLVEPVYASTPSDSLDSNVCRRVGSKLQYLSRDVTRFRLVTFGTPVRYGWDTNVVGSLMHVVHHRPASGDKPYVAPFPQSIPDVVNCTYGDFVQQIGIAGTDFLPYLLRRETYRAERALNSFLQPNLPRRRLLVRLAHGQRLHADGMNVLVDYPDDEQALRTKMLGHGIYTRREWLAFHAEQIARHILQPT